MSQQPWSPPADTFLSGPGDPAQQFTAGDKPQAGAVSTRALWSLLPLPFLRATLFYSHCMATDPGSFQPWDVIRNGKGAREAVFPFPPREGWARQEPRLTVAQQPLLSSVSARPPRLPVLLKEALMTGGTVVVGGSPGRRPPPCAPESQRLRDTVCALRVSVQPERRGV